MDRVSLLQAIRVFRLLASEFRSLDLQATRSLFRITTLHLLQTIPKQWATFQVHKCIQMSSRSVQDRACQPSNLAQVSQDCSPRTFRLPNHFRSKLVETFSSV